MLAKTLVFKALETLALYEIDLNAFIKMPKYQAISKLEPKVYSLINKKLANYAGCINIHQARLYAKDFALYYVNNYQLLSTFRPLFKIAKKVNDGKKLRTHDVELMHKNKFDFFCLYFLKTGRDYKKGRDLEGDIAAFVKKYYA